MSLLPKRRGPTDLSGPATRFRQEFDSLFNDFLGRFPAIADDFGIGRGFPALDVTETDQAVEVTAEVPGMTAEEVEVTVTEDALVIRGEKKETVEEKGKTAHRIERRYGRFERVVALPAEVDAEKASAECSEGVLVVRLPKKPEEQAKRRRIEVK